MNIVAIADLQGMCKLIAPEMLPKGDMLLIAGDLASWGTLKELQDVNEWLKTLDYTHIVVVGGNHDQALEQHDGHKIFTNAIYLQDELVEIEGLRIYGSPMSEMNEFRLISHWGFCESDYIRTVCDNIPDNLDILITHGPCYGILDEVWAGQSVGSKELREAVLAKKPRYHCFGHIHQGHNRVNITSSPTTFVNGAICSERNELFGNNGKLYFEPIVIEVS